MSIIKSLQRVFFNVGAILFFATDTKLFLHPTEQFHRWNSPKHDHCALVASCNLSEILNTLSFFYRELSFVLANYYFLLFTK